MIGADLFLGLPLTEEIHSLLDRLPASERALFIRKGEEYLQEAEFEGKTYIGKWAGDAIELAELELLEANIYTLLARLIPTIKKEDYPLLLLSRCNIDAKL